MTCNGKKRIGSCGDSIRVENRKTELLPVGRKGMQIKLIFPLKNNVAFFVAFVLEFASSKVVSSYFPHPLLVFRLLFGSLILLNISNASPERRMSWSTNVGPFDQEDITFT